jgi:hypothetical protein
MGGDVGLAAAAQQEPVFSLTPLQDGTFNYGGDGEMITFIELRGAELQLHGTNNTVISVRSDDFAATLSEELPYLSMQAGTVAKAQLRYHVQPVRGKPKTVAVHVNPPHKTRIFQKQFARSIEQHLRTQGVLRK